jgi:hypothetical protein
MPRRERYVGKTLRSKVKFTLYAQVAHLKWVESVAAPNGMSEFIDNLIYRAKERYENRKLKSIARRQRVEIGRLEAEIVRLGGTVVASPVTLESVNEELQ